MSILSTQVTEFNPYRHVGDNSLYNDDFSPSKGYKRVLFQPGRPVQARELTQMQTAMQYQLSACGSFMFKDGQAINGARISYSLDQPTIKIEPTDINNRQVNLDDLVGKVFVEQSDTAQSILVTGYIESSEANGFHTLLISYLGGDINTGTAVFISAKTYDGQRYSFKKTSQIVTPCVTGHVTPGTLFVDGYFVDVSQEDIVVSLTVEDDVEYHIGFYVNRNYITSNEDTTLNDNASGSTNFNAPGADRYQIKLELVGYAGDDTTVSQDFLEHFIPGIVVKNDVIILEQMRGANGELLDTLAKRTFEESGSYTVKPWKVSLEDYDNETFLASVQPGTGYIEGYRVSNNVSQDLVVPKPRTFIQKEITNTYYQGGVYTIGNYNETTTYNGTTITGEAQALDANLMPHPHLLEEVYVYSQKRSASDGAVNEEYILGSAVVYSYGRVGNEFRIYLKDIEEVRNKFTGAKSLVTHDGKGYINLRLNEYGYAELIGQQSAQIVEIPYKYVKDIRDESDKKETLQYETVKMYSTRSNAANSPSITITDGDYTVDFGSWSYLIDIYETDTGTHVNINKLKVTPDNSASMAKVVIESESNTSEGTALKTNTNYTVIMRVLRNNMTTIRKKVLTKYVETLSSQVVGSTRSDYLQLSKEDVASIVSATVTRSTSSNAATITTGDTDITKYLSLDTGQTDFYYGKGGIYGVTSSDVLDKLTGNKNGAFNIVITYMYYEHDGFTGPFTAESYVSTVNDSLVEDLNLADGEYVADSYSAIPKYYDSVGKEYNLRDCIDFRVKLSELGNNENTNNYPSASTLVEYSPKIYLGRYDVVWVDKNANFGIEAGIPAEAPVAPFVKTNTFPIALLKHAPYMPTIKSTKIEEIYTKGYTMADIGLLEKRIERTEELIAFTMLEQKAVNVQIMDENGFDRFKTGIFTDSFANFDNAECSNPLWNCNYDAIEYCLRSNFNAENLEFTFNESNSSAVLDGVIISLPYETEVYAHNLYVSESTNIQKYMFYSWTGNCQLSPSVDNWVEELENHVVKTTYVDTPSPGTKWVDWRRWIATTKTTGYYVYDNLYGKYEHKAVGYITKLGYEAKDLGFQYGYDEVLDTQSEKIEFMRERKVNYSVSGMRPGVHIMAMMDNKWNLSLSNAIVDQNGKLEGYFTIPKGVPCGQKLVKFYDLSGFCSAQAMYTANGSKVWNNVSRFYIREWEYEETASVQKDCKYDPLAESFYVEEEDGIYIHSIDLFFTSKDENGMSAGIYLVECENGIPKTDHIPLSDVILDSSKINIDTTNPLTAPTRFVFKQPIYLRGKTEYAFVVWASSYQFSVCTSTLGKTNIYQDPNGRGAPNGFAIAEQPYTGCMFLSQNQRTWTPQQESDITFVLNKCVFSTNVYTATFDLDMSLMSKDTFEVAYKCLCINDFIPSYTDIQYQYRWYNESTWTQFTNKQDIYLDILKNLDKTLTQTPLQIIATMSTNNKNLTPQIDLEGVYGIFCNNDVTPIKNAQGNILRYDAGTYISKTVTMDNDASDIRVILDVLRPNPDADIEVYFKTSSYHPSFVEKADYSSTLCCDESVIPEMIGKSCQVVYYNYGVTTGTSSGRLEPMCQCVISGYEDGKIYISSVSNTSVFKNVSNVSQTSFNYQELGTGYQAILIIDGYLTNNTTCSPYLTGVDYPVGTFVTHNNSIWVANQRVNQTQIGNIMPSSVSTYWTLLNAIKTKTVLKTEDELVEWRPMELSTDVSIYNPSSYVEQEYVPKLAIESTFQKFQVRISMFSPDKIAIPKVKNLRAIAVL